jgi:hypothetical protein
MSISFKKITELISVEANSMEIDPAERQEFKRLAESIFSIESSLASMSQREKRDRMRDEIIRSIDKKASAK